MTFYKKYNNGLRLVIHRIEGLLSVTSGILVKTGSRNETEEENGISHFIEHTMFKGTKKRTAFDISDEIDCVGAQINAFTSKELTCYYTKSTSEHLEKTLDILSDIFFNSTFDSVELEKEKGVIIEEINMCEDTPEDICLDLLAESYYGKEGLGRTILGPIKNIKRFTREDIINYMNKYYTADNVVISIAGNVDVDYAEKLVDKMFNQEFCKGTCASQKGYDIMERRNLYRTKKIEQSHIGLVMPAYSVIDERGDALSIANIIFGGGMSSRLFQKVREELGLCYSVYSYVSQYKDNGVLEIYGGVNTENRDNAVKAILEEIENFRNNGVTSKEFYRGKEQIKSAIIMGRENTATQMLLHGKYLCFLNKELDFNERLERLKNITEEDVDKVIKEIFNPALISSATVGPKRNALKIK